MNLPQLDGMPMDTLGSQNAPHVRGSCRDADSYPFNHSSAEDGCEVTLVYEGGSIVEHREGYINLKVILYFLVFETLVGFYDFY